VSVLAETGPVEITEAGVYDIDAEVYHADPLRHLGGSLSSSGARTIIGKCPAKFRYEQDHPPEPTKAMELGTAAHKEVLGAGPELVRMTHDTYRTANAQAERDEAYERGAIPLKPAEHDQVQEMAAALRAHELASVLLGGTGAAEQALFWKDGPSRIWRRALLDWLPPPEPTGVMYLADYKKSQSAHPAAISRAIETYGLHMQGAWYVDGVKALGLAEDVKYFLVVQEESAPYLVSVVELKEIALDMGRHENRKAIDLYVKCRKDDHWPPYVEGVEQIGLPPWAEKKFLEEVTS
jgi:hypothetical protein